MTVVAALSSLSLRGAVWLGILVTFWGGVAWLVF